MTIILSYSGEHASSEATSTAEERRAAGANWITDTLRSWIASGFLTVGESLPQQELADCLGVSRTPLREAIIRLESEGFVVRTRNRTAVVARRLPAEIAEIFDIRIELECLATRKAVAIITPDECSDLFEVLNELLAATSASEFSRLNSDFHLRLYQSAQQPRLLEMIRALRIQSTPYAHAIIVPTSPLRDSGAYIDQLQSEHQQIFLNVKAGNEEEAAALLRSHLEAARSSVLTALFNVPA